MSYRRARLSISPAALSARAHSTTAGAAVGGWCSTAAAAAGRKGWWPSGGVTPPPWCGSCPTWCAPPPCGSGGRAFARDPARRTLRPGGAAIQTLLRDVGGRRRAAFAALLRISPRANAPARPRALPNARAHTHAGYHVPLLRGVQGRPPLDRCRRRGLRPPRTRRRCAGRA